jgi:hypothetical protein
MGARRYPVLLALALIVFAMHSAIAHKEYRFVLLGTTSLILLAALGSVDILNLLFTRAPFADLHLSDGLRLSLLAALWPRSVSPSHFAILLSLTGAKATSNSPLWCSPGNNPDSAALQALMRTITRRWR